MNDDWLDFIRSEGIPDAPGDASGTPLSEAAHTLSTGLKVAATHLRVLDVCGADAASFLQSQGCNDQALLAPSRAQINGYCQPKGRLLAIFVQYPIEHGFRVVLPASIREGFIKRLRMYVLRASVTLAERDDLVCIGLQGTGLQGVAAELGAPEIQAAPMSLGQAGQGHALRWWDSLAAPRWLLVVPVPEAMNLWHSASDAAAAGADAWRLGDIRAGIPTITSANLETFVPQMVNLQLIGGLSFRKGCYPGQEIVARMHYLGRLKRQMVRLQVPGLLQAPAAGDSFGRDGNESLARVVDAISTDAGVDLLAVVPVDVPVADLSLEGHAVQMAPMGYPLTAAAGTAESAAGSAAAADPAAPAR